LEHAERRVRREDFHEFQYPLRVEMGWNLTVSRLRCGLNI